MKSETLCVLPWIHIATMTDGCTSLCCIAHARPELDLNNMTFKEIWNSDFFKDTRCKMIRGEKVKECAHCYSEEENGIRSHRINENIIWNRELGEDYIEDLVKSTKSDGTLETDFVTIDMRLGNKCNFQCIFCKPSDSVSWLKNAKILSQDLISQIKWEWDYKANIDQSRFDWYKSDRFKDDFYRILPNMRHIIFGGGEPCITPEHDEIIKECLPYADNMRLRYHTNGTGVKDKLDMWSKFDYVEVMLSLDAIGDKNEYIRYPSKWSNTLDCINALDDTPDNIEPKVLLSICALNIYYLPEITEWFLSQDFKKFGVKAHAGLFHPGIVHYPEYLTAKALPEGLKFIITERVDKLCESIPDNFQIQRFKSLLSFMNSENRTDLWEQTIEYLEMLDALRGTDFKLTFPEVAEWT